jgi:hypothetical protein
VHENIGFLEVIPDVLAGFFEFGIDVSLVVILNVDSEVGAYVVSAYFLLDFKQFVGAVVEERQDASDAPIFDALGAIQNAQAAEIEVAPL